MSDRWAFIGGMRAAALTLLPAALLSAGPVGAAEPADEATIQLYKAKCQACHMPDGNAQIPEMNFTNGNWAHGSKLADVIKVIEEGVPGKAMIGFKTQLTKEQIEALARYVRTFDKKLKPEKGGKGSK